MGLHGKQISQRQYFFPRYIPNTSGKLREGDTAMSQVPYNCTVSAQPDTFSDFDVGPS